MFESGAALQADWEGFSVVGPLRPIVTSIAVRSMQWDKRNGVCCDCIRQGRKGN